MFTPTGLNKMAWSSSILLAAAAVCSLVLSVGAATDFCSLGCVNDIYSRSCGLAKCVVGVSQSAQVRISLPNSYPCLTFFLGYAQR